MRKIAFALTSCNIALATALPASADYVLSAPEVVVTSSPGAPAQAGALIGFSGINGNTRIAYTTGNGGTNDPRRNRIWITEYDLGSSAWTPVADYAFDEGNVGYVGPTGIAVTDYDNDGRKDIIVGHQNGFHIFFNDGIGGYSQIFAYQGPAVDDAFTVLAADVNGDGFPDIITVPSSGRFTVYYNDTLRGIASFEQQAGPFMGGNVARVGFFDGSWTLVISSNADAGINYFWRWRLQPGLPFVDAYGDATDEVYGMEVADVTGDGFDDVILTLRTRDALLVYAQVPSQPLTGPMVYQTNSAPQSVIRTSTGCDSDILISHGQGAKLVGWFNIDNSVIQTPEINKDMTPFAENGYYAPASIISAIIDLGGDYDVVTVGANTGVLWMSGGCMCFTNPLDSYNGFKLTKSPGILDVTYQWSIVPGTAETWPSLFASAPTIGQPVQDMCNRKFQTSCKAIGEVLQPPNIRFYGLEAYCGETP